METVYSTSTGYKILYSIIGISSVVFGVRIMVEPIGSASPLLLGIPILAIIGGVTLLLKLWKRKLTITTDSVTKAGIFKATTIPLEHIKGFRASRSVISIEPDQEAYSNIVLRDCETIGKKDDLVNWLTANFKDLDIQAFEAQKDEILHDATVGISEDERKRRFNFSLSNANLYSLVGFGLFLASLIWDEYEDIIAYVLLLYPLAGIILMHYSHGLVRFDAGKGSAYGSVYLGFLFPSVALGLPLINDSQVLSYDHLWMPLGVIGFMIFISIYFTGIKRAGQVQNRPVIFALLISVIYVFGSVMQTNRVFDGSKPQVFDVKVLHQDVSIASSTTAYYLTLSDFGPYHHLKRFQVSKNFFLSMEFERPVKVYVKKGTFAIPWYYLGTP